MKQHDFTAFEELEQAETAWKNGILLGQRTENFHSMWLYLLDDNYVEITYHTHFNVLLHIKSFKDTEQLEPYLAQIDLSALLADL